MNINCKGKLIDLSVPKVMGILNLTPDSFYDGGKFRSEKKVLEHTEKMLSEGATFIDVGAYSSRPGATHISEEEELQRLIPMVELLLKEFPNILISVDTFRSIVAEKAVGAGVAMINDISAGNLDKNMFETVAKLQVPYIMMHMKGNPQTMKNETDYKNLLQEIIFYFSEKITLLRKLGVNDILVDPGFGFSKNIQQNFEVMNRLSIFQNLDVSVLVGVSRKSMIYKTLETSAANALNGTTFLNTIALMNGAKILRVHDVKEAVECTKLFAQLKN